MGADIGVGVRFATLGEGQSRAPRLPATRDFVARRTTEGKTSREIKRCLARYVARDLYRQLETDHNCLTEHKSVAGVLWLPVLVGRIGRANDGEQQR